MSFDGESQKDQNSLSEASDRTGGGSKSRNANLAFDLWSEGAQSQGLPAAPGTEARMLSATNRLLSRCVALRRNRLICSCAKKP